MSDLTMGSNSSRGSSDSVPTYRTGKNVNSSVQGLQVFIGPLVHSLSWENPFDIVSDGVIGVKDGRIIFVDTVQNLESLRSSHSFTDKDVYRLNDREFLMPGMVDTHIHAPQYPNSGLGMDLELLKWLQKYTFPLESKYKDTEFAEMVYRRVVERTLSFGTTMASYFATIHKDSSVILADLVEAYGQRALIGKVCMDCYCPDYYVETTEESLAATTEFVKQVLGRKNPLVLPTITPRFALTCTEELLKGLGDLAKEHNVHIQTHLSESISEIERLKEIFPQYKNYPEVYAKTGLLTDKAIMAHCVHLTDDEIQTLKAHNTSVAHCPSSNICLLSGLCPVKKIRNAGVKVGLGTDCAGGYSTSILEVIRDAIKTAKVLAIHGKETAPLDFKEAFYLATLGGAEALVMEKEVGNFQVGKSFDALLIGLDSKASAVDVFPGSTITDLVEKFLMLGDDRNIKKVFVNGQVVKSL